MKRMNKILSLALAAIFTCSTFNVSASMSGEMNSSEADGVLTNFDELYEVKAIEFSDPVPLELATLNNESDYISEIVHESEISAEDYEQYNNLGAEDTNPENQDVQAFSSSADIVINNFRAAQSKY